MIRQVSIENYKSIVKLKLELGRVTVLIGENGGGKSNILEALALAAAASSNKLDNEFLASRGIRVTSPTLMRSAFQAEDGNKPITLSVEGEGSYTCSLTNDNKPYARWKARHEIAAEDLAGNPELIDHLKAALDKKPRMVHAVVEILREALDFKGQGLNLKDFLIYSPENSALRTFEEEEQVEPLGINGAGLFKLLKVLNAANPDKIAAIKQRLRLINWFQDFDLPGDLAFNEAHIRIWDKFLPAKVGPYDQKSANEGFLFLLFYISVFVSDEAPKFFAIDNVEASLNPKLCTRLMTEIADLAEAHDKQVILTTHNPAVLDGLNLDNEDHKVLVVSRTKNGRTKVQPLQKPRLAKGEAPLKLSEAFMNGMLGGLPKGF